MDGFIQVADNRVQIQNLYRLSRITYFVGIFWLSDNCAPREGADDVLNFVFE